MNYVNSIKVSQSLESVTTPEGTEEAAVEVTATPIIDETEIVQKTSNLESDSGGSQLTEYIRSNWLDEAKVEVEVVELTKSVKEILQFPEIEDIPEVAKSGETNESPADEIAIEHIDLIREAKELPTEQRTKKIGKKGKSSPKIGDEAELNDSEGYFEGYFEEQPAYAKLEEIDLLSSIGRDIGVDLEKYVQPVPDVVAMEAVNVQGSRSLPAILKDAIRQDTNKLLDHDLPDVSSADTRKKEKMARNQARRRQSSHSSSTQNRRPDKRRADHIADNGLGKIILLECCNEKNR